MMNYNESYHFLGMHFLWWILLATMVILIFSLFYKNWGKKTSIESPLEILKRRLTLGEISKDEFQQIKNIIEN